MQAKHAAEACIHTQEGELVSRCADDRHLHGLGVDGYVPAEGR